MLRYASTVRPSAQLCEKKAEEFVRRELETIEQDEWSSDHFYEENDESNPKVIAENGAKATGWMMLQCAADIRKMISNADVCGLPHGKEDK